jgi:hypothetical protein
MFRKTNLAAALAAAVLGAAALASPASAQPTDSFTLDPNNNHRFSFGEDCDIGVGPASDGLLDWDNNAANTSGQPHLTGTLCLQDTTAQARMHVIYHDSLGGDITHFHTNPATGNGDDLNEFSVDEQGDRISYQTLHHVHVDLEKNNGGGWVQADTITLFP